MAGGRQKFCLTRSIKTVIRVCACRYITIRSWTPTIETSSTCRTSWPSPRLPTAAKMWIFCSQIENRNTKVWVTWEGPVRLAQVTHQITSYLRTCVRRPLRLRVLLAGPKACRSWLGKSKIVRITGSWTTLAMVRLLISCWQTSAIRLI